MDAFKRRRSSAGASRVSPSPSQGSAAAQLTIAGYGPSAGDSSQSSIPNGACSRTSPAYAREGSQACSPILPLSGAMRNGAISERPTWAHRTDARASSSSPTETDDDSTDIEPSSIAPWPSSENAPAWPTPAASTPNDGEDPATWIARRQKHASAPEATTRAGLPLAIAAKLWPTATATDASASARHGYMITGHSGTTLTDAIRQWSASADPSWPTPMARDRKGAGTNGGRSPTLETAARAWPTPMRADADRGLSSRFKRGNPTLGSTALEHHSHQDHSIATGGIDGSAPVYLHPSFVEALMGFPIGWTVCRRSETLSFLP